MAAIMYRLLKDLIDWRGNLYIKCKSGKFSVKSFLVLSIVLLDCAASAQSVTNKSSIGISRDSNKSSRAHSKRTIFDHGIFRHDKPKDAMISPYPPKSELGSSAKDAVHHTCQSSPHGCHTSDSTLPPSPPTGDNRDRYTYDRFKRSVTTLNFHPKPKNESRNVAVKPLRIFKYITEDDILLNPQSSERQHVTIFHPLVTAANAKKKSSKNAKGEASLTITTTVDNDTSHQQVIGGTKVNLKAKLDIKNHQNITSDTTNQSSSDSNGADTNDGSANEFKSRQINKAASKPENILIFKPSLAIRKSNKTSLIPSGNHPPKHGSFINGDGNSIIPSITAAVKHDESADPNSSTVNDGSLIHNNLFDSVVMLSEEGQKQLLLQQHQSEEVHREQARKSSSGNSAKYGNDDDGAGNGDDDEIKKSKFATPSSSFSSKSNANNKNEASINVKATVKNTKNNDKKFSPSLPIPSTTQPRITTNTGNSSSSANNNTKNKTSDLVEKLIHKIDATIGENGNKDKVIVTVVKSKKSKSSKKSQSLLQQQGLDEDDIAQDGSERSRRSPFKVPIKFQQSNNNNNNNAPRFSRLAQATNGVQQKFTRDALFRRNPAATRIRSAPFFTKKVAPRILTPVSHYTMPGKMHHQARTVLPMKPMPMTAPARPNLALQSGPIRPGPVGPPIAAIKITNLNKLNSNKKNIVPPTLINGKDLMGDASRTVYSYKPLTAEDVILNQAASSYYSPTYKRFKNRFHNQIASMMESQRELEDTIHRLEESRYPTRHSRHRHTKNSGRNHRDHPRFQDKRDRERDRERDRYDHHDRSRERDRYPHTHHRSGQHGHHPHHHRHSPSRGKKLGPKYTYPKNAENIQDILNFFDKEAPHRGPMSSSFDKEGAASPRRQHSVLPGESSQAAPPKLADLSGEFRDVHASLLKDIREFAKRPNLFGNSDKSDRSRSHSHDSHENGSPFDPIDDIFGSKPKPVRDMIKPDLYSLENIRERIALKRGKLHGRYRDKDKDSNSQHDEAHHREHHDEQRPHTDDDDAFYDSHRPSRQNSDGGQSAEAVKNSLYSKEEYDSPSTYSRREKHREGDDSHTIFPSSHFPNEKENIKENSNPFEYNSAEFAKTPSRPSLNKPIVLKRPNEPFRVREAEPKKKPEHDYFWNTFANGIDRAPTVNYDAPLVIKTPAPSVLQPINPYSAFSHPANAATHSLVKPLSMDMEDEDIVEIHTGGPGAASGVPSFPASPDPNRFKQEKLKKMYMDVLQQKMQLEAALYNPQTLPTMPTSVHHAHHPGLSAMHPSASIHPQHNPMQMLTRVGHAPQMSAYPQTPTVTLPPMNGLASITRRKKPMRMKIHIYPNGNDGLEQGLEAANLLAGGFGSSGFSASNPPGVVAPPPKDIGLIKPSDSAIPSGPTGPLPTSPSGFGATSIHPSMSGPMAPMSNSNKNKNVVLHLHVHRRNDMLGPLELEAEGSAPVPATLKPLTYKPKDYRIIRAFKTFPNSRQRVRMRRERGGVLG